MTSPHELFAQRGPLPHASSPLSAPFWAGCAQNELRYQRCDQCRAANFPPTEHCRFCLCAELTWSVSAARGEIYSWTVVYRPVSGQFTPPYAPAIVTLAEGYQMLTNIIDTDIAALRVGLRVRAEFRSAGDDLTLPYFTADEGQR